VGASFWRGRRSHRAAPPRCPSDGFNLPGRRQTALVFVGGQLPSAPPALGLHFGLGAADAAISWRFPWPRPPPGTVDDSAALGGRRLVKSPPRRLMGFPEVRVAGYPR